MPYKQSRNENGSSHKYINSTWCGGILNETLRKKIGNIVLLKYGFTFIFSTIP